MTDTEWRGTIDEILLLHRNLIEEVLYPLQENDQLDDRLQDFRVCISKLQTDEPSFWKLKIVKAIQSVLKSWIIEHKLQEEEEEEEDMVTSDVRVGDVVVDAAKSTVKSSLEYEAAQLRETLNDVYAGQKIDQPHQVEEIDDVLQLQWDRLMSLAQQMQQYDIRDDYIDDMESCSIEVINFDDINDESGSLRSVSPFEAIPAIIKKLQSSDHVDNATALCELLKIPIFELVHCGMYFRDLCTGIIGLFLRVDNQRTDVQSKALVYDLLSHIEDAMQFLDVYFIMLAFVGEHLMSGELFLESKHLCNPSDEVSICVADVFRIVLLLVSRVPCHWIHFTNETLARVCHSTFQLLLMYSNVNTAVEGKYAKPLDIFSLLDDHANWFKQWLLKCPDREQLFLALNESGFINDQLWHLSRFRPLAHLRSQRSIVDDIELRSTKYVLAMFSYILEFQKGREVMFRWKPIPIQSQMKYRQTKWTKPEDIELSTQKKENDRLFHLNRWMVFQDEVDLGTKEIERLGASILDKIILAIVAVTLLTPSQGDKFQTIPEQLGDAWGDKMMGSMAKYIHYTCRRGGVMPILLHVRRPAVAQVCCLMGNSEEMKPAIQEELQDSWDSWFPFRQQAMPCDEQKLIADAIAIRVQTGHISLADVKQRVIWLALVFVSSDEIIPMILAMPEEEDQQLMLHLFQCIIEQLIKPWDDASVSHGENYQKRFISSVQIIFTSPRLYSRSRSFGILNNIATLNAIAAKTERESQRDLALQSWIGSSTRGLRDLYANGDAGLLFQRIISSCRDQYERQQYSRQVLRLLTLAPLSATFFSSDYIHDALLDSVEMLKTSKDFSIALNSSLEECPAELTEAMEMLIFMRCYLSTQYAASTLSSSPPSAQNPIIKFILETMQHHGESCLSSSVNEDTCCVGFLLALALSTSIPSVLSCHAHFSEVNVSHDRDKESSQTPDGNIIGSCSFLANELYREYMLVGGSNERPLRCDLAKLSEEACVDISRTCNGDSTLFCNAHVKIPSFSKDYVAVLQQKMLRSIQESTLQSASLDYVVLSQATWELITELEKGPSTGKLRAPTDEFTIMFGKLIYHAVISGRSRFTTRSDMMNSPVTDNLSVSVQESKDASDFFPPDAERKLMNRLYKSYCHRLALRASPTSLHCIIKQFGESAIDCFPVSMLMILGQFCDDKEIIGFLLRSQRSPLIHFLWPKANVTSEKYTKLGAPGLWIIAEAAEVILETEFPHILRALDQCCCSVLILILRWQSQCFWNYFDWENIVLYIYMTILFGPEFQVYFVVAIMKHLEVPLQELAGKYHTQSVEPFLDLIQLPIVNFRFTPWRNLFMRLRNKYHDQITILLNDVGPDTVVGIH